MSRIYKFIFAALILFLFAEILIYAPQTLEQAVETPSPVGDPARDDEAAEFTDPRLRGEQIIRKFHLVETKDEKKDWELYANKAQGGQKRERWNLEEVKVIFYSSPSVTFTVTGEKGRFELKSKNMEFEGGVKVVSSNGYVFRSEKVDYDSQNRILSSPGAVRIQGPPDVDGHRLALRGGSMLANINTSEVQIANTVRASKTLDGQRELQVKSGVANISGRSYKAEFVKNVELSLNSIKAKGPKAVFRIDADSKKILSAAMGGGVSISEADKSAQSKELLFDFPKDQIELTGHPRLLQGEDEIAGDVIVFLEGGKKVRVEDARARVRSSENMGR